jgi:chromosome segregation ATPase
MPDEQIGVDYTQAINELANRLRVLEGKQSLYSEKLLVMNQNMIEEYKKTLKEIKATDMEVRELKNDIKNIKNIIKHLTDEADKFAMKNDIKVLEKYIKLWDPIQFVTEKDVQDMIQKAQEHKKVKKHGASK